MGSCNSRIFVSVDDGVRLEASFRVGSPLEAVLICHPHPLYGGDMDNNVVLAIEDAFLSCGFSTLRFNFRGVGMSTGVYSGGSGEELDVLACYRFLKNRGVGEIWAAGYSFGAWVLARIMDRVKDWAGMVLVSPPVDFMAFPGFSEPSFPTLVLFGSKDPYCSPPSLAKWIGDVTENVEKLMVEGADHFYVGHGGSIAEAIKKFLDEHKKRRIINKVR
ncbi:alpha/beta hydrolase [Thermodesulforhabdus norvegica]|uniref:Alpha/beta hydrolase n=1 Tax=Thermodesulforhabdus norvegica TaxID=39841 RepID=A0A1I4SX73_9BACT|nr:hypothetical protein [Thermodesulforhabdus norvegica]SFM69031.1 hypothetical protein SAMN05660836_01214 [Thermodesulforhabdus norvegica]